MPTLTLRLKRLGKKRVKEIPYELTETPGNLRELLGACVRAEVARFNASREDPLIFRFLTPEDIGKGATAGKVHFGVIHQTDTADPEAAVEVALQGWEDGLFSVFQGDQELRSLEDPIDLTATEAFTFLRLTFLTGTFW